MAAVSASANVQSLYVCSQHERGTRPNFCSSDFLQPFTNSASSDHASEHRALKRRKLESGEGEPVDNSDVFDARESVVIGKVTLDLCWPVGTMAQSPPKDAQGGLLDVFLESFSRTSADCFAIKLRNPTSPALASGIDVHASATTAVLETISPHLGFVVALSNTVFVPGKTGRRTKTSNVGACFCRCVLFQSPTSLGCVTLVAEVRWCVAIPVSEAINSRISAFKPRYRLHHEILSSYFPRGGEHQTVPWSLNDFYNAVYTPSSERLLAPQLKDSLLETTLYPFQTRAVEWLLRREGVEYPISGGALSPIDESSAPLPISLLPEKDATGEEIYVSHLRGLVLRDPNAMKGPPLRGGILAEEMGLGKTVELLALMRHHRRQIPASDVFDAYSGTTVKASGATLIITPPSILEQWMNEIAVHAPTLMVKHYKGIPAPSASAQEHEEATVEHLMQYDVVLTTYGVLSREIHFAAPPPERSLRHKKRHEARKSPLVQISWWRVCLDEAQMVESGVSNAATVARVIPRCNAWAVSGTPLRKDVSDLRGLLVFLRYEPFAGRTIWDRLDRSSFQTLFNEITLRHTKEKVRDELRLPPQKRVVITVPFTAIEEQNYSDMIRQMCEACGLSPEGVTLQEGRDVTDTEVIERMREWLVRLRQTCLHAHVGKKNRAALKAKGGPIRTVHEVLEIMIDQNDTAKKTEAREYILTLLRSGHIKGNAENDDRRSQSALPYYKEALQHAQKWVKLCRDELSEEQKKVGRPVLDQLDAEEESKESENLGRIPTIRSSLRSFAELEHACKFFIGTVYFQIKSNESLTPPDSESFYSLEKLEVQWYDDAKVIRKELLQESQRKAQQQMKRISSTRPFYQLSRISDLPDLGGIEGRKVLTMMDNVCDILNAQAEQLEKWRQKIVDILLLPLVDQEEKDTTGDEYEDSTKVQDELYVYTLALRGLVAIRSEAVNGEADLLASYDLKTAEKLALGKLNPESDWRGHAPELVLEVVQICNKLKPAKELGSLKGVVAATRSLLTTLQWKVDGGDHRASAELSILEKQLFKIQQTASKEAKALSELEKEQELFRNAMNQRLEFYRQLQHISDTVAPWREKLDPEFDKKAFEANLGKQAATKKRLTSCVSQHAYLLNLRAENQQADEVRECIICKCDFEAGVLTSCGHTYCKECIMEWWGSHRNCPVCKEKLRFKDLKDISFKPVAIRAKEEHHGQASKSAASTPPSTHSSIYSDISNSTMNEIKMIDLDGSYGSKIDMIARHLLWIRVNDPGAKSIIFSQFGDFLEVLREALKRWKVGCSSIRDKNGISKFRSDAAVDCFLLDAKSDSSGLNLVNATYVFLCEPLINPAIELQAIARVHRIGQQRPTTVFMYLVSDTVEEAIYDISVSRRLEHMGQASKAATERGKPKPRLGEKTLDAANSMELEAAPLKQLLRKKGDGEIVKAEDLWNCLFGKLRKQRGEEVLDQVVGRHLRAEAAEGRISETEV